MREENALRQRRLALGACVAALVGIVACAPGRPRSARAGETRAVGTDAEAADIATCDLGAPIARATRGGAQVGALAVRLRDGAVLAEHDAGLPLVPASTQKLLTALAALSRFGPTHRFVTEVWSEAPPDAEGRVGLLTVRGGGDPALVPEDWIRLATELRRTGLRQVARLAVDDRAFDAERRHPAWGASGGRAYEAPISALSSGYGALTVTVEPGRAVGLPLRAIVDPPFDASALEMRGTTGTRGSAAALWVERGGEVRERLVVSGSLPLGGAAETVYRSVGDATRHAGETIAWALRANGISVEAGPEIAAAPPADGVRLLAFSGRDLAEIVRAMLKWSSNPIAEGLLKALGAHASAEPGSFENGAAALRSTLVAQGIDLTGATLVDGSGLATTNRVTARQLVEVLRVAQRSVEIGPELLAALPIAGRDGTLRSRAGGARDRVRAKTGTLTGVAALAGLAYTADGESVAFAMIVNDGEAAGTAALDSFAEALARCPSAAP